MTRVLVLGAGGMLGHKVLQILTSGHTAIGTLRGSASDDPYHRIPMFRDGDVVEGVHADDWSTVTGAIDATKPEVVVNCIGVIKHRDTGDDPIANITVNALFPHRLAEHCENLGLRMIHFSTDCVFNGSRGGYTEDDIADAEDLYGRTKYLGEVADRAGVLTLRTSLVGRELTVFGSLLEWFLAQKGAVRGFRGGFFGGHHQLDGRSGSQPHRRAPRSGGQIPGRRAADRQVRPAPPVRQRLPPGHGDHPGRRLRARSQPGRRPIRRGDRHPAAIMGGDGRRDGRRPHTLRGVEMTKERPLEGKRILVTGGTGSLGKLLVKRLLGGEMGNPARIIVFSRDEAKQHEMRLDYLHRRAATDEAIFRNFERELEFWIGDVRDPESVRSVMQNVDVVFNAAALKQVPTCEYFPFEAVQTNIGGAENIVRAIRENHLAVDTV